MRAIRYGATLVVCLLCLGGCMTHGVTGRQEVNHSIRGKQEQNVRVRHDDQKVDVIIWRAKRWQRNRRP